MLTQRARVLAGVINSYRHESLAAIRHRNELFALAMRAVDDTTSSDDHKKLC